MSREYLQTEKHAFPAYQYQPGINISGKVETNSRRTLAPGPYELGFVFSLKHLAPMGFCTCNPSLDRSGHTNYK
jgi:hypothetical protein